MKPIQEKRLTSVSAALYPSLSGGVFACDDDVCEAALMDEVLVEGRCAECVGCPHPLRPSIESIDALLPTAEYANSAWLE